MNREDFPRWFRCNPLVRMKIACIRQYFILSFNAIIHIGLMLLLHSYEPIQKKRNQRSFKSKLLPVYSSFFVYFDVLQLRVYWLWVIDSWKFRVDSLEFRVVESLELKVDSKICVFSDICEIKSFSLSNLSAFSALSARVFPSFSLPNPSNTCDTWKYNNKL